MNTGKRKKLILGPLEQKVMECIWDRDETTCREILNCLNYAAKKKMAYTTLMTVMDRLFDKGFLTRKKKGKTYIYAFKKTREETLSILSNNMLDTLVDRFGDDALETFDRELRKRKRKK